jgi:hypothetical protein
LDGKFEAGKCSYPDGKVYEGKWKDGKPSGYGIKTWPDGRKYEGDWRGGKPIGSGKKIYPDGKMKEGYWEKGRFVEGVPPTGYNAGFSMEKEEENSKNEVDDMDHGKKFTLTQ